MIFPSLPPDAGVRHALALNPRAGRLLASYHEQILRGDSPLSVAERELIAAYVSGLNRCRYCCGTHSATARFFGASENAVEELLADDTLSSAPPRLRSMLAFARALTLRHESITAADADAVYAAGWSERALHDLILVASTFNFMNRFVHGHGISGDDELMEERGRYLHEHGYAGIVAAAEEPADPRPEFA
jgi:uncharacterized peroxidase-related enzyme